MVNAGAVYFDVSLSFVSGFVNKFVSYFLNASKILIFDDLHKRTQSIQNHFITDVCIWGLYFKCRLIVIIISHLVVFIICIECLHIFYRMNEWPLEAKTFAASSW